ncbi:hypothetical protein NQ318_009355 [Aromia moschata]|uniref:Chromatin assembly factor 1 subunit A dimerization domain-containing protein n=1 Tax=Aromia moschata TaxID=1265417 RepID=A0AAV8XB32_9CUCU|nr:hypothetical protein NQ318_009355 [Aromia moschata]
MVTSGMSYAVHYELGGHGQDSVLQEFSRMRLEAHREQPVLYVAMATWIPKCNMYHQNNVQDPSSPVEHLQIIQENVCETIEEAKGNTTEINKDVIKGGQDKLKITETKNSMEVSSNQCELQNHSTEVQFKGGTEEQKTVDAKQHEKLDSFKTVENQDREQNQIYLNKKETNEDSSENEDSDTANAHDETDSNKDECFTVKNKLQITPQKVLSPRQLQKRLDSEKKRKERQLEKEEKERKRVEEKERIKQEKLKKKKEKEMREEQKRKEREEKEEQKRKEREEKEQKKKEKEEKEEQKRKEREQEKLKKQQEIEEKNKEKQKEEEKKQKAAAAFKIKKAETIQPYAFKAFEVKSDMKLPPIRRNPLTEKEKETLKYYFENPDNNASYIKDLKEGKPTGKCFKTWPFEETIDEDIAIIEDGSNLGETICEDKKNQKLRAKFLKFHENRRPPYFGTWRKKSVLVTPRRPIAEDTNMFNYEEDSDDDWEEEEQGESLNGSDEEVDKENDDEKDDYEVDNDFFVPHGHLSEDEIDDEEKSRLSPESFKQKLKLLKDEFDQDMQSKTHKLKPRSIGCIWYNKDGNNVDDAILKYLQPLTIICNGSIEVKKRDEIFTTTGKRSKPIPELDMEHIPLFLKVIHGNCNKKRVLVEQFLTYMANNGYGNIDISKTALVRNLRNFADWTKYKEDGPMKNKFCWIVKQDVERKYNVDLSFPNILESTVKE